MRSWPLYLIFILILVLSPLWMGSYGIYILSMALVMSIAAVGLDVLMGYAGQVCFGQAGFVAVGAYVTAFLVNQGLSFWISWPIGGLMAGFSGFIIGAPALKIRGHYLALATLSFAYIIYLVLMHWESVTGGPRGMLALRPDWPLSFEGDISIFYLILGSTIAMFILARNIISSKYGRAFMSLQKDEIVSKNMGINLFRYKTLAFIISSIYGGIAGGLYGPLIGFLDPLSFGVLESAYFMLMVLMGGRGTLIGGILGAFIYVSIPEFFRSTAYFQEVIYGFIFLIV
ncbi:MAG: branched-chain amino acid ABC transporter permease, partial [Desulfatiglandales bacterium]|nr:branched-chain amino acid ABC transporter permease [Desulfatiglandales bacterium]